MEKLYWPGVFVRLRIPRAMRDEAFSRGVVLATHTSHDYNGEKKLVEVGWFDSDGLPEKNISHHPAELERLPDQVAGPIPAEITYNISPGEFPERSPCSTPST